MIDNLCDDNFLIYAMKAYDKSNCIMSEFEEDIKRIKYIKRLIRKYRVTGDLKERLILNHIIILANTFSIESVVKMLFFKIDEEDYAVLKTFLLFLQYMPKHILGVNGRNIYSADISVDLLVGRKLKENI
jgi:hypothetical protein